MVEVTLLEINLEGSSFTATAPFSSVDSDEESESAPDPDGGYCWLVVGGVLVGLILLIIGLRRVLTGEGSLDLPWAEGLSPTTE